MKPLVYTCAAYAAWAGNWLVGYWAFDLSKFFIACALGWPLMILVGVFIAMAVREHGKESPQC